MGYCEIKELGLDGIWPGQQGSFYISLDWVEFGSQKQHKLMQINYICRESVSFCRSFCYFKKNADHIHGYILHTDLHSLVTGEQDVSSKEVISL